MRITTANADYISLADDIQAAALSGNQMLVLPDGSIDLPPGTHFTLDAVQQLVIEDVAQALFGTAAASDGATLDIAFDNRTNPNSNTPFVDAVVTAMNATVNPCFAAGTHILTVRGEILVEDLDVGDVLITHAGEEQAIVWIGQRRLQIADHPRPETVQPVMIAPDALADGVPGRPLFVSPDHGVFLDGVLVPAKELLNWTTIRQDNTAMEVEYYHLELAQHDIIFAEGVPVESYLDTGHRGVFDNAGKVVIAHPALMQQRREAEGCAPLCLGGPILAEIRHRIASRQAGIQLAGF
jgi:Hint domain